MPEIAHGTKTEWSEELDPLTLLLIEARFFELEARQLRDCAKPKQVHVCRGVQESGATIGYGKLIKSLVV